MATKTRKQPNPDGLAAALDAGSHLQRNTGGVKCHVTLVLQQLPQELEPKVRKAVNSATVPASALAQMLSDNGYEIRAASISRHRHRGTATGCRCPQ